MRKRAAASGVINVVSLGFSAGLEYASEGIKKVDKIGELAKNVWKNISSIGKNSCKAVDVASAFATTHFTIWGTLS